MTRVRFQLRKLLGAPGWREFRSRWPDEFMSSHGGSTRFRDFSLQAGIDTVEAFARNYRGAVTLWTLSAKKNRKILVPQHRKAVSADRALFYYELGATLYFSSIERHSPFLARTCRAVESELGIAAGTCRLELFASRAGAGTPMHCDHDLNLNIQLTGRKEWVVAENREIPNPLSQYIPGDSTLKEEIRSYASGTVSPSASRRRFRTRPGSLVFLPQGYWHATECLEDSLALTFALTPASWIDLLTSELRAQAIREPVLRKRVVPPVKSRAIASVRSSIARTLERLESRSPEAMLKRIRVKR